MAGSFVQSAALTDGDSDVDSSQCIGCFAPFGVSPGCSAPQKPVRRRLNKIAGADLPHSKGTASSSLAKRHLPSSLPAGLPPELWGRVPLWLRPREFLRLCRCNSILFHPRERQKLWRFFCHLEGYARLVDDAVETFSCAGADCVAGKLRGQWPDGFDWQRIFQLNALADAAMASRGPFASIRVRDEELRVPCLPGLPGRDSPLTAAAGNSGRNTGRLFGSGAISSMLAGRSSAGPQDEEHPWLIMETVAQPACLRKAIEKILCPTEVYPGITFKQSRVPFRLRELVAGRPGGLLSRAKLYSRGGPANVLLEWPIGRTVHGTWIWTLPPHHLATRQDAPTEPRYVSHPAGPRYVTLPVEPNLDTRRGGWMVELIPSESLSRRSAKTSSKGRPTWVHLGLHKPTGQLTLAEMCSELSSHLHVFGIPSRTPVFHGDLQSPPEPLEKVWPGWLLRRDCRWIQGERLIVHETVVEGNRARFWESSFSVHKGQRIVLFQRDSLRRQRQLLRKPVQDPEKFQSAIEPRFARPMDADHYGAAKGSSESSVVPARRSSLLDTDEDAPLNTHMPHTRSLLLSSNAVRQFEFHPTRPGVMLAGHKDGMVSVLNYESDSQTHVAEVDAYPILGLSWLQTHPQRAVFGASQSGTVGILGYNEDKPGRMEHKQLEPFLHLSSLSVNCTDDFFMTSGFCLDLALYDLGTGLRLSTFVGLHHFFINILRFSHRSPHLFATASFDHTCKVWDLRVPIHENKPVTTFRTDTLNVMCCFSPDDKHILCSGVDTALQQFSLEMPGDAGTTSRFPLPPLHSGTNYRRSVYLADGNLIATAGTNENYLRLYTAAQPHRHRGLIDFRNMLQQRHQSTETSCSPYSGVDRSQRGGGVVASAPSAAGGLRGRSQPAAPAQAAGDGAGATDEYVQSMRCHPSDPSVLGALLATCDDLNPESYIAMLRLGS